MGIHHFKLAVVPRVCFGQQLPAVLSEAEREQGEGSASGWWAAHPPSGEFLSSLRTLLPTDNSWGETDEYVSDSDWGSDIRIWKDAGRVWSIAFRFAPGLDGWPLMQRFLAMVRDEQCVLIEETSGAVFEPDEEMARDKLIASRAMQFIRDPEGTIVQAARELKDDDD